MLPDQPGGTVPSPSDPDLRAEYDEPEQTTGFFTMFEEHLSPPFENRRARRGATMRYQPR